MAKNYFEHETQVKYVEGLLSNSDQWQWLIEYIENNFQVKTEIDSFESFTNCFRTIHEVYFHLIKIREISPDCTLLFSQLWLEQLYKVAGIFIGKIPLIKNDFNSDFFNILAITVYTTRLINVKNDLNYAIDFRIFTTTNLYELVDLSGIKEENLNIFEAINEIHLNDIDSILDAYNKNIRNEEQSYTACFFDTYTDNLLRANAFNMQHITNITVSTWQERYLLDMLMIEIDERKLIPLAQFVNNSNPDISLWTEEILNKMLSFFMNDIATFVIETIRYIQYNRKMSVKTIQKHFELLANFIDQHTKDTENIYELECSSLKVCSYLLADGIIPDEIKGSCLGMLSKKTSEIENLNILLLIEQYGFRLSKKQEQNLKDYHKKKYQEIYNITNSNELCEYFLNKDVKKHINQECFMETHSRFIGIVSNMTDSLLANIFYNYMIFLLELQNNPEIQRNSLRIIIIKIKHLWQETYYDICYKSMQTFLYKVTMTAEEIAAQKETLINKPFDIAYSVMLQKKMTLLKN
ncbi:MAG: hypothetical protein ACYC00_20005 [Eubacteriales bacterium]